jgi:hypothetical protein
MAVDADRAQVPWALVEKYGAFTKNRPAPIAQMMDLVCLLSAVIAIWVVKELS